MSFPFRAGFCHNYRARERGSSDNFGHRNCVNLRESCKGRKSVGRDNAQSTTQLRQN